MLKTITKEEVIELFDKVFFSAESKRLDIEMMADVHKEEQEEQFESNKEHQMFQGKVREEVTVEALKNKSQYHAN